MSDLPEVVQKIRATPGVLRVTVLDQRGAIRAQVGTKDEKKLADYIAFMAVTSAQARNYMNISVPNRARIVLSSGQTLLILFGEELSAGILLEEDTEYLDIIDNFASVINELKL